MPNLKIHEVLKDLGLKDKEPIIYVELLKYPTPQPASTISKNLKLNRSTTYKSLINLWKSGLITKTEQNGISTFLAENPEETLLTKTKKKAEKINKMNELILETIPLLTSNHVGQNHPKVRYFEDIDGIKKVYDLIIKTEKDIYRYGDITKIYQALGPFTDEYIKKRNKIGLTTHAIMPLIANSSKNLKKHQNESRKVMFIPQNQFTIDGEIRVFGDYVAIMSLVSEAPMAVVIESKIISKMFMSVFMLTWQEQ